MNSSYPFFVLVGIGLTLLVVVLLASIIVGAVRHRVGRRFSAEIEEAAAMGTSRQLPRRARPRRHAHA